MVGWSCLMWRISCVGFGRLGVNAGTFGQRWLDVEIVTFAAGGWRQMLNRRRQEGGDYDIFIQSSVSV